jgi:hypothetical protein
MYDIIMFVCLMCVCDFAYFECLQMTQKSPSRYKYAKRNHFKICTIHVCYLRKELYRYFKSPI